MKYLVSRKNKRFWNAVHQLNSSPLWMCIIPTSWPLKINNNKSPLIISVSNDPLFKVLTTATNLKYKTYEE